MSLLALPHRQQALHTLVPKNCRPSIAGDVRQPAEALAIPHPLTGAHRARCRL